MVLLRSTRWSSGSTALCGARCIAAISTMSIACAIISQSCNDSALNPFPLCLRG